MELFAVILVEKYCCFNLYFFFACNILLKWKENFHISVGSAFAIGPLSFTRREKEQEYYWLQAILVRRWIGVDWRNWSVRDFCLVHDDFMAKNNWELFYNWFRFIEKLWRYVSDLSTSTVVFMSNRAAMDCSYSVYCTDVFTRFVVELAISLK